MALRKEKLEGFRKDLLAKRAILAQGIQEATHELIQGEEAFTDEIDLANAQVDRAMMLQVKTRERESLLQIDEALKRIEAGNFGECEVCDEPISEARMQAYPATTLCIDCQAELESERRR